MESSPHWYSVLHRRFLPKSSLCERGCRNSRVYKCKEEKIAHHTHAFDDKSELKGKNIYLRQLLDKDAPKMLDIRIRNKEFFKPYDPPVPPRYFTLQGQLEIIREFQRSYTNGTAAGFGVFLGDSDELIGRVALRNIQRGAAQSSTLGYFVDQQYTNRGYITEAAGLLVKYAFDVLGLHRVEAAIMPSNAASIRVVEKLNFRREGLARWLLFIDDDWKDHYIFAITKSTSLKK